MKKDKTAKASPILHVERLERPWQTLDPFLVVAHHDDHYPRANGALGPDADLAVRPPGNDFTSIDGWNMYFGRTVPGFPRHPHRGFETVTYVHNGWVDHSDSLGARGRYGHGDVQWMTAGRGINHAEMFPLLDDTAENPLDLFQIWLNLPAKSKFVDPGYQMLWSEQIPTVDNNRGATVTVIAGAYDGHVAPRPPTDSWANAPDNDVAIFHIALQPHGSMRLPAQKPSSNRVLYLFGKGDLVIDGDRVPAGSAVKLDPAKEALLSAADHGTAAFVLNGAPIGEPVVAKGPFVMNTKAEIDEAFADFRRTGFGRWPWSDDGPTHGTNPQSFSDQLEQTTDNAPSVNEPHATKRRAG